MFISPLVQERMALWAKAWLDSYVGNQKRMLLALNNGQGPTYVNSSIEELAVEWNPRLEFEPGNKYIRVVQTSDREFDRSAHAFLNPVTGDILKAASWKAPAKHVRFNLLDDQSFEKMLARLDWAGGYLYK